MNLMHRRCAGSAMTEFAVLCVFLMVPLMLAIPMLGNMVDMRQTAVQAGRYATWQSTVQSQGVQDHALLRDRFFSRSDALISSHTSDAGHNVLWGEGNEPDGVLRSASDIEVDTETVGMNTRLHADDDGLGIASGIGAVVETAGDAIGTLTGREWGLGETALTRTEISLAVKANEWGRNTGTNEACGGGMGCMFEGGAILVDGWSASGDAQAKERTQALVPATALESVGDVLSVLGAVPVFKELGRLDGMFGYVDMAPLPEHADRGLDRYVED